MAPPTILITGATGFLGFRTLLDLLESSHAVLAAVRSDAKADTLRSHPLVRAALAAHPTAALSFVLVPDITQPDAYHAALTAHPAITGILHIASPLPGKNADAPDYAAAILRPAVDGTLALLNAAHTATPNVSRVVITSSIAALIPPEALFVQAPDLDASPAITHATRTPIPAGPYAHPFVAYGASKIAALAAAEDWVAQHHPRFTTIHIHPSFVLGRNDFAASSADLFEGSNLLAVSQAAGLPAADEANFPTRPNTTVHIADVARLHVQSLTVALPPPAGPAAAAARVESFIANADNLDPGFWARVPEILAVAFPAQPKVQRHVAQARQDAANGLPKTVVNKVDSRRTEDVFGWRFKSLEDQVRDAVAQWAEF